MNNAILQFNDSVNKNVNRMINICNANDNVVNNELKLSPIDDAFHELKIPIDRISTGYLEVDELFGEFVNGEYQMGFRRKDILIIAGMSGIGKTSFAFSIFANLYRQKRKCVFFSLDMRSEKTWDCFKNALSGYHTDKFTFADDIALNGDHPMIVAHNGMINVKQIDNFLKDKQIEVIFIDYIDYLEPSKKDTSDAANFKNLFLELKALTNKHNCAIVLLSQSMEDKHYRSGRPSLGSLYGGKAVRSAVDHVLAVYRNSKYNDKLTTENKNVTEIIALKLRSNSTNDKVFLKHKNGKILSMSEIEIANYKDNLLNGC